MIALDKFVVQTLRKASKLRLVDGSQAVRKVVLSNRGMAFDGDEVSGLYNWWERSVTVAEDKNELAVAYAFCHELGHAMLHYDGNFAASEVPAMELQAEYFAWSLWRALKMPDQGRVYSILQSSMDYADVSGWPSHVVLKSLGDNDVFLHGLMQATRVLTP